jgi:uncharacterized protein (DUF4415 family)
MSNERPRRHADPRQAAEAMFKAVTQKRVDIPASKPSLPNAKELVSLRLDRDVLEHFQAEGAGWQERINAALRKMIENQG